ncbi:MAG: hypothetical protein B7733_12870 [Myxococcales bacterium FL481]|nr:MAG: hypothetical protein B7733_12870 [Myxococcales bacterium FL481]
MLSEIYREAGPTVHGSSLASLGWSSPSCEIRYHGLVAGPNPSVWLRASIRADDHVLIPLLGLVLLFGAAGWRFARRSHDR